jgi:predicted translin family RNA/ssDNA-binding protein
MVNKKFFQELKNDYLKRNKERSKIIGLSNIILHDSKRAIFALHRADVKRAGELLLSVEQILSELEENMGCERISHEGAYKAAVEEYVEAKMFYQVMAGKKVDKIDKFKLETESILGGICDLTGELVRRAVNLAGEGKFKEVKKMKDAVNEIMAELVEFDMTGYLRTKYDQAKTNLKKIEHISYEIKLRGK